MKKITLLLCLFTGLSAISQMTIQYGGSIGIDWNYRTLSNNSDPFGVNEAIISGRNDIEKFCTRPSIRFDFKINLTDKIGVRTGFGYDVKGYRVQDEWLSGTQTGVGNFRLFAYDHFIGIPVLFSYTLPMGLELNGGISNDFYLGTNTKTVVKYENGDKQVYKSDHSSYNRYMGMGVIGCNYVFPGWGGQMFIGPDFRFAFTSLTGATNIREYYYSIGLNFGIIFGGAA